MEKIKQDSFSGYFPGIRLQREDLDWILKICSDEKVDKIEISDGEYAYSSLDEALQNIGGVPGKLEIKGSSPGNLFSYVSLDFGNRLGGKLRLYASGKGAENIFLRVKDVFNKRRSIKYFLYHPLFFFVLISAFSYNFFHPFLGAFLSTLLITMLLSMPWVFGYYSSISLTPKSQKKSFWQRNKDHIVVGVISALVSALITFGLTKLLL